MRIREVLWLHSVVDKIQSKHGVTTGEAEFVLEHSPLVRFMQRGDVKGEDLYAALGRTAAGRHLIIFFVHKPGAQAMPISARDMDQKEKRLYGRQKKGQA